MFFNVLFVFGIFFEPDLVGISDRFRTDFEVDFWIESGIDFGVPKQWFWDGFGDGFGDAEKGMSKWRCLELPELTGTRGT